MKPFLSVWTHRGGSTIFHCSNNPIREFIHFHSTTDDRRKTAAVETTPWWRTDNLHRRSWVMTSVGGKWHGVCPTRVGMEHQNTSIGIEQGRSDITLRSWITIVPHCILRILSFLRSTDFFVRRGQMTGPVHRDTIQSPFPTRSDRFGGTGWDDIPEGSALPDLPGIDVDGECFHDFIVNFYLTNPGCEGDLVFTNIKDTC